MNERDKQRALQQGRELDLRSSSADLLDLVRTAEQDARLALRKRTPAVALPVASRPAEEEVVDVGDEAVDAPPSIPPMRSATPANAFATHPGARSKTSAFQRVPVEQGRRGLPAVLGILLIVALAVGALAIVTR